jgi:ABC-type Fe3+/spermidine/putrescine transport system ATPase subunit
MPSFSRYIKPSVNTRDEPLGKLTRDAIEEMRQELKEQKEKLSKQGKQEYND